MSSIVRARLSHTHRSCAHAIISALEVTWFPEEFEHTDKTQVEYVPCVVYLLQALACGVAACLYVYAGVCQ